MFLSQGLVDKLSTEEIEAILAYELVSIKTHNTLASTIASGIMAGLLIVPTPIIDRGISWAIDRKWEPQSLDNLWYGFSFPYACLF
ncbi:MAG: hypothetical protein R2827_06805 [Bdellovibrionales bacterium]